MNFKFIIIQKFNINMASCKYKPTGKVLGYGKYGTNKEVTLDNTNYTLKVYTPDSKYELFNDKSKFGKLKSDVNYNSIVNPAEVDVYFRFNSPNLLGGKYIAEINECDYNSPGVVMDYVENTVISDLTLLSFDDKKKILKGIVKALQCLHKNNYLHLNCTLQNCIYRKGKDPEGVLADYSQSVYVRGGVSKGILTQLNRTDGTYKAPETLYKVDGENYFYTNKADIWSLGILICRLFTNNFEIFFESIYKDIEKNDYESLGEFYLEFMNERVIEEFITTIIMPEITSIHPEANDIEKRAEIKNLLMATLRIDPAKRSNIDAIVSLFVKDSVNTCGFFPIERVYLEKLDKDLFVGIYDIINICKDKFYSKNLGVLFMAIDLYMRYILYNKSTTKILPETCCLVAIKYFYWSELQDLTVEEYNILNADEFKVREVKLYKDLKGKINEERYFNNAKSKRELYEVYKAFIYPSNKENTLNVKNKKKEIQINKFIVNYLAEDGTTFFNRLDLKKTDNLRELTIAGFFN